MNDGHGGQGGLGTRAVLVAASPADERATAKSGMRQWRLRVATAVLAVLVGVAATACQPPPPPTVGACFRFENGAAWINEPVYLETATQSVATAYSDQQGCVRFDFFSAANGSYRLRVYSPRSYGGYILGVWHSETAFTYIGATGHTQLAAPSVVYFQYL